MTTRGVVIVAGKELIKHSPECPEARLDVVTAYCFGDLGVAERESFERHLLDCEACWREVRRLEPAVGVLRSEKNLGESLRGYDMPVLLGTSSRLTLPFGGHLWHVVIACGLYALLHAVALILEVTYHLDRYRPTVWWVSVGVFIWVLVTSAAGLAIDWKFATRPKASKPTYFSIPVFIVSSLLLYAALKLYLPDSPITEAEFQTYPAHAAYLKDIGYFLPLGIVFLVLTYHFILSMQRELSAGRHRLGFALLSDEKWSVTPRGSIYLRVWWLGLLLFGALIVSLTLTTHLFDNLMPGDYRGLFVQLVLWRMVLYFSLGLECLFWYYRSLNELKRECVGVVAAAQLPRG